MKIFAVILLSGCLSDPVPLQRAVGSCPGCAGSVLTDPAGASWQWSSGAAGMLGNFGVVDPGDGRNSPFVWSASSYPNGWGDPRNNFVVRFGHNLGANGPINPNDGRFGMVFEQHYDNEFGDPQFEWYLVGGVANRDGKRVIALNTSKTDPELVKLFLHAPQTTISAGPEYHGIFVATQALIFESPDGRRSLTVTNDYTRFIDQGGRSLYFSDQPGNEQSRLVRVGGGISPTAPNVGDLGYYQAPWRESYLRTYGGCGSTEERPACYWIHEGQWYTVCSSPGQRSRTYVCQIDEAGVPGWAEK